MREIIQYFKKNVNTQARADTVFNCKFKERIVLKQTPLPNGETRVTTGEIRGHSSLSGEAAAYFGPLPALSANGG